MKKMLVLYVQVSDACVQIMVCFAFNEVISLDYDECEDEPCHRDAMCRNKLGSFECICKAGYKGDGMTCQGNYYYLS